MRLGMYHWGCMAYQVCSNDDPRVTLTYLKSRISLLPNAFEWEFFEKLIFEYCERVIILTCYVQSSVYK